MVPFVLTELDVLALTFLLSPSLRNLWYSKHMLPQVASLV